MHHWIDPEQADEVWPTNAKKHIYLLLSLAENGDPRFWSSIVFSKEADAIDFAAYQKEEHGNLFEVVPLELSLPDLPSRASFANLAGKAGVDLYRTMYQLVAD
jgi:hypothetical protein